MKNISLTEKMKSFYFKGKMGHDMRECYKRNQTVQRPRWGPIGDFDLLRQKEKKETRNEKYSRIKFLFLWYDLLRSADLYFTF